MVDVLVIGSGGAALSAALAANKDGASVLVVTKGGLSNSQSVMAQGGINAALGNVEEDSIQAHIQDTLNSAKGLAKRNMVELMCQNAPLTIAYLETLGVDFSRIEANTPLKSIAQRRLGGAGSARACYAQDYTGLKIVHTLIDNVLNSDIAVKTNHFLLNLIVEDGTIRGAVFLDIDNGNIVEVIAKSVIVATGGFGGLYYKHTTNNYAASGDGIVAVLKAGGKVSNMEFVQFHPTALKNSLVLISESARGEGGYLVNSDNERFVDELLSRDKVSLAIYEQLKAGKEVFLDLRHLDSEYLKHVMPQELKFCEIYENIDATKELIPIRAVAHYTMGGVEVDQEFEVDGIKNCYCVGEASNAYVHGANRLGGNSLLEIITFGKIAGQNAAHRAKGINSFEISAEHITNATNAIRAILSNKGEQSFYPLRERLGDVMFDNVGILRDGASLEMAINQIKAIGQEFLKCEVANKSAQANGELIEYLEFANMLNLSIVVASMAMARQESRGAHIRADFKEQNSKFDNCFIFAYNQQ